MGIEEREQKITKDSAGRRQHASKTMSGRHFLQSVGDKTRGLFILSVVICLLMFLILAWILISSKRQKNQGVYVNQRSTNQLGFSLSASDGETVYPFGSHYLLRLGAEQVSLLTTTGSEELNLMVQCADPKVVFGGEYALVFDYNGSNFYLITQRGMLYHGDTKDEPIGSAAVSSTGYVALVLNSNGTRGVLRVLNPEGIHQFDYQVRERNSSGYILSAAFSQNDQYVDLSMLNTDGVEPFSIIQRFDLMTSKLSAYYVCDTNEPLPVLTGGQDQQLIAAGNQSIFRLTGDQMSPWIKLADIKQVVSDRDGVVVLASDSVRGEAKLLRMEFENEGIESLDASGQYVTVGADPKNLCIGGGYAAVSDGAVCYRVKLSDMTVERIEAGTEVVHLGLDGKGNLTVVTRDQVRVY